ncbi:PREDICTED: semaphorin-2A-like [Amphimedon queenslandica]|uniref:Sema domain-containing protein n=1 Tax=Amphimedon queenslandica TaxID=400682 RepID=A0AAN0JEG5_AMPQE|nr:PREDICTED: semaphorin-2A-like [Amphimedon queenslandica]|eukprot:XP_019855410.1 PREDICTED: semaphorin-2A-like [Amphimedon queenslandica]
MRLCALLIPVLLATTSYSQDYTYWNHPQIELTNLFKIDYASDLIILAAKNNILHLTLDLQTILNAQNATPSATKIHTCRTSNAIFESLANCQNFHHILHIPTTDTLLSLDNNQTVPLNETILACGSDAYQPLCFYRNRTDLTLLKSYEARNFCPFGRSFVSASTLSSNGNLVSGTSLNVRASSYGLSLSHSPFNGTASVTTINYYISFQEPEFVDVYEFGDYYYFFMRETAEEIGQVSMRPIYSRVGRVCKNDTGVTNILIPTSTKVFVTYLKARIMCQSRAKSRNDVRFTFNSLQDTVHVSNVSGEYMYGAFTSSENGPAGSAICVYTLNGENTNDLSDVFTKSYLKPVAVNDWDTVPNNNPVTVSDYTKMLYNLHLLKKTYVSSRQGSKDFTSQNVELERNTENGEGQVVGMMELYKTKANNSVYVYLSTSEGLYVVPLDDCERLYSTCSECISSRDPYCAYHVEEGKCVSTINSVGGSGSLLQDIVNGDSSICFVAHYTTTVSPSPTIATLSTVDLSAISPSETSVMRPTVPVGRVFGGALEEHAWTIAASAGGLIVGVVVGYLMLAFITNKVRIYSKSLSHRNQPTDHRQKST